MSLPDRRTLYLPWFGVAENNLNRPDMDGRYTLVTTELLGHVRLINKRAAFRVPTSTDGYTV